MGLKRGHPVYCRDPADWDRIRKRADSVGRSVSEFVMTCALHDGDATPPTVLALTPERQLELYRNVREMHRRIEQIFDERMDGFPGIDSAVRLLFLLHGGEENLHLLAEGDE
ncbi:MAG: hypothetical protein F4145_07595 [Boseongicola sp. SB0675_bin_26]|nr:hypothetical protein [Boseongicola sp.]MXX91306.1 hypothetical protein [Boseongicola sp. SB0665_bin_10]MYG25462.1 hypothetical protein [Boseongicola sp. SB0677_bin_26]MYH57844.1 hypothetical protein [Boseongicola sp. SB0675_bin_26]